MLNLSNKKILVTGGAGMIGSHISSKLQKRGARVVILDNFMAYPFDYSVEFGTRLKDIEIIDGSIMDRNLVSDIMKDTDIVIHAAAYADVGASVRNYDIDFQVNVVGTEIVLEEAKKANVEKFTFVSSAAVYGEETSDSREPIFSENQRCKPISTYGNSKLWGETQTQLFSKLYGMSTTLVRYFSVYGSPQVPKEGSHSWCVAIFSMLAMKGKDITVFGDGKQIRDFTHVSDIAEGTVLATLNPSTDGKIINIGRGKPTEIISIAEKIIHRIGKVDIKFKPRPPGDPIGGYADVERMKKLLNWQPKVSIDEGIDEYCDWVKDNKHIVPEWI